MCVRSQLERTLEGAVAWAEPYSPGPFTIPFHYTVSYEGEGRSSDMTLIATVWSPEGFAIAADGFQVAPDGSETYTAQKIFHTPFNNGTGFAYACSGTCGWMFQSGDYFDFIDATRRATDDLAKAPFPNDPADYFREIGERLFQDLAYPTDGSTSNPDLFGTKLIFVGYANRQALWAELTFDYVGSRFSRPQLIGPNYSPMDFRVIAGSPTVQGQMEADGLFKPSYFLSAAIAAVRAYAEKCVGNKSVPDCVNLRGHIHIATVTPAGFEWDTKPSGLRSIDSQPQPH